MGIGKRIARGALAVATAMAASTVAAQPAAAASSCQLRMEHHEYWEAVVTCHTSRVGALVGAVVVMGDDGWWFDQYVYSICCMEPLQKPATGTIRLVGDDFSFNEDAALPYDNDEIYVIVVMVDPNQDINWEVRTNTVSGDFV